MKLLCIGEAMVELSPQGEGLYRQGFAGDTLNTAWYARARLGEGVGFASVIGTDAISQEMARFVASAGIDITRLRRDPEHTVGLYMISLRNGERSFSYWRGQSAARHLADDAEWLSQAFVGVDMLYLSGITLAILPPEGRGRLFDALQTARRQGARMAFDSNLRPRLWASDQEMRETVMQAAALCDIALPSFDDEAAQFGDKTPQATLERYVQAGAREVVLKNGGEEMWLCFDGRMQAIDPGDPVMPVDTTGAGDSFDGTYLACRLQGVVPATALALGHATAREVVRHRGALMPQELIPA